MLLDDRKHLEKMVEKCQEVLIVSQPADEKVVDVKKPKLTQTCPTQWTVTDVFHFD